MKKYDIVVVGGGPAGYVSAIRASQLGASVCLIEQERLGGTCLNHGCIPTKTLLHNADFLREVTKMHKRGIHFADPTVRIDFPAMIRHKDGVVQKLVTGLASLVKSHGIEVIQDRVVINPDFSIVVGDSKIRGEKIIAAGGSEAVRLSVPGTDGPRILTNREILALDSLPPKLVIVGGGVIGVEMARLFSILGSDVTVLETAPSLVPSFDTEISNLVMKSLEKSGVRIVLGKEVKCFEETKHGVLVIDTENGRYEATHVLQAIGRKANLSLFSDLKIKTDRGFVQVDAHMQTSISKLYAPGDVNGQCMLAHAAFQMAEIAANHALGVRSPHGFLRSVPKVLYGFPEVASVGMTEKEIADTKRPVRVGRFYFSANGRAVASGEDSGVVKILCDAEYGEILGVHMIGPNASEMINEASALMSAEVTAHELSSSIHAHPTYSEALAEAAADAFGMSTHVLKKK